VSKIFVLKIIKIW